MTPAATFDEARAAGNAARAVRDRLAEVREQAEAEAQASLDAIDAYAKHLAAGGAADAGFEREMRYGGPKLVRATPYLEIVYREWNEARGGRNPYSPLEELGKWEIAEYGLAHVGEPVTYATYRDEVTTAGRNRWAQSDDVARALAACQGDDLVLRRVKVGGKVAYLLRERREGEEFVGRIDGLDAGRPRVSLFAANVPEERWTP